jgi:hypothetical protein
LSFYDSRYCVVYSKESHGGSSLESAVRDIALVGQVLDRIDGRNHSLDGEEGRQIGRVRRDDYEREEPPNAADNPRRRRLLPQPVTQWDNTDGEDIKATHTHINISVIIIIA